MKPSTFTSASQARHYGCSPWWRESELKSIMTISASSLPIWMKPSTFTSARPAIHYSSSPWWRQSELNCQLWIWVVDLNQTFCSTVSLQPLMICNCQNFGSQILVTLFKVQQINTCAGLTVALRGIKPSTHFLLTPNPGHPAFFVSSNCDEMTGGWANQIKTCRNTGKSNTNRKQVLVVVK